MFIKVYVYKRCFFMGTTQLNLKTFARCIFLPQKQGVSLNHKSLSKGRGYIGRYSNATR